MRKRVCREIRAAKEERQNKTQQQQHTFRTAAVGKLTGVNKKDC